MGRQFHWLSYLVGAIATFALAIAYNLPEVESGLKLTRAALADIFLGKLTQWNDPAIATVETIQTAN
ncbi:substrate-binding domain-containing protein [Oscillatoria sp. CS-180]|uniref:substrate-binding domain-containing protein n=1 Tax=Oscillatoria sp. CS-180 TaxID=3021720 RepID=UPI00232BA87D|nr:substrate-binding domain-containing protein [Oscillatoria sp. CS-180]MDB9527612.1 substrate-binding domain-containing protein [Oscillatoria sp. CS-180]